jgi:hypothetical protein
MTPDSVATTWLSSQVVTLSCVVVTGGSANGDDVMVQK